MDIAGGLGNYLFSMSSTVAARYTVGNDPQNIKDPGTAWMIAYLFVANFSGFFFMIPLQKVRTYIIISIQITCSLSLSLSP